MSVLLINLAVGLTIILFLLILYLCSCRKDKLYIEKCIENNEKLILRVSGYCYVEGIIDSSCLISIKLKDKNIIYNRTVFKRFFNLGPNYLLIENFHRNSDINKALTSFLSDYDFNFEKEIIKV